MAIFALSNGPLAWAIIAWRNSMVFHSIDKITSIMIHLGPPILCAALRHVAVQEDLVISKAHVGAKFKLTSWWALPLTALITYVIWQLFYLIIVSVFRKKVIEQRNYATSFSYLCRPKAPNQRPGFIARSCNVMGPKYRFLMFTLLQFVYALVTIIPTKILWDYPSIHELFLATMTTVSVWNAANFYIEIFSKRYIIEIQDGHLETATVISGMCVCMFFVLMLMYLRVLT